MPDFDPTNYTPSHERERLRCQIERNYWRAQHWRVTPGISCRAQRGQIDALVRVKGTLIVKHILKIWPMFFESVIAGDKRFEIRRNENRGFQKGDVVVLTEYNPEMTEPFRITGREVIAEITYVSDFNQPQNQVVFGFDVKDVISP